MTAFDLYEQIVGEGGIDPEYFLHRMEWWEVNRYRAGVRRRYHAQWETTRWTISYLVNMFREKDKPTIKLNEVAKFPWEKDMPQEEITDNEITELEAELKAWEATNQEDPQ